MTESIWHGTAHEGRFPALKDEIAVDVAIIGGGITGISTALLLSKGGVRVAVLEASRLGMGTTGHSTGNLYAPVDWHLYALEDKWDRGTIQAVAHSRQDAVDLIELTVRTYGLDCDFARRPFCFFSTNGDRSELEMIEREHRAALDANLNAHLVDTLPLPLPVAKALVIEGQAQFHPLNYVRDLARKIASDLCLVFENSQATHIDDEGGVIETDTGRVRADRIVMATHTPKGVYAVHTEMEVWREYGIAARLRDGGYPQGIFWSAGSKHSVRSLDTDGKPYLIVVGEKHKTGHEEHTEARVQSLERFTRDNFDVSAIGYAWSAQNYRSADFLPYIGKSPGAERTYIATGFATDGLTYGTLAAMLISEEIFGRENKWSDLYDAGRITPAKSARGVASESASVAHHLVRDYARRLPVEFEDVPADEGRLLEIQGEKVAVYRDVNHNFTVLSSTCTHLGCMVHWNNGEKTWDCPCHGSRFTIQGDVLEGPAVSALLRYYPTTEAPEPRPPIRETERPARKP